MKDSQIGIKSSNPKDIQGVKKIPFHLWPETATMVGVIQMLDGAKKYGRSNYRKEGVKASVYYDAIRRHLTDWFEGEDRTTDTALRHFGGILASAAILVDAQVAGILIDDRMYPNKGYKSLRGELTKEVSRVMQMYGWANPIHYSLLSTKRKEVVRSKLSKRKKS